MIFSVVAVSVTELKVVFIAHTLDVGIKLIGTGKNAGLIGTHNKRLSAAGDFALAVANNDDGRVTRLIHIDSVSAGAGGIESQVRRIDFKNFVTTQTSNTNPQRTFGDLQLSGSIIEVQKRKASAGAESNRRRAEMQFRSRIVVDPQFVTGGQRPIHNRGHPILGARRLK